MRENQTIKAPYGYVDPHRDGHQHADGSRCAPTDKGYWLEAGEGLNAICCLSHAEEPLADWERELLRGATVTQDAENAVYGDRATNYGHPREDFTRTAILWQGLLHHKLADGESISPEDVARCMIGVKLARDVHSPLRDNRVDIAGYALCLDRLETGK